MRPYDKYAESRVGWIGDIPAHWEDMPLRALADGRGAFTDGDWIESPYITDRGIRLIQTGNIGIGIYREQGFRYISEDTFFELNCTEVEPADILICRLAEPVGRACLAPNIGTKMITSVDVCILKLKPDINRQYVAHVLSSPEYLGFMESWCRGGTRDRVSRRFLGSVRVPVPPPDEQRAIAAFLDRETAKIDALVAEQRRLIALLKEKRQAVISHAVTKGLDPTVPMKPSGIEWLGDVPAHWEVSRVKHVSEITPGYAFPSSGFRHDGEGVRLLRGVNVGVGATRWDEVVYWERSADDNLDDFELQIDDIVVGLDRPWIGSGTRVAILREADVPALLLQRVGRVRAKRKIFPDYIYFLIADESFRHSCLPETTGVSVPHISTEQLANFFIPLPPFEEQVCIIRYVKEKCSKLSSLELEAQQAIELLQERRSALISAAVTGKIDVRDAVPEQTEAA